MVTWNCCIYIWNTELGKVLTIAHPLSCSCTPLPPSVHLGYRIRLGSSTDKKDTGRLHVDFAQARDDLYEWECKQRMLAREERHRRRMEEERLRPPSPPPVVHYSDHECSIVAEKLKGIESTWALWLKELFPLGKLNKYICTIGSYPLNFPLTGSKYFLCCSLPDRELYPVTEELENLSLTPVSLLLHCLKGWRFSLHT